jgi:hypothetical protein
LITIQRDEHCGRPNAEGYGEIKASMRSFRRVEEGKGELLWCISALGGMHYWEAKRV